MNEPSPPSTAAPAVPAGPGGFSRPAPVRTPPRRVTGGIALRASTWPMNDLGPVARSLLEAAVRHAPSDALVQEAFTDFAQRGQTRSLMYAPGVIDALIQGHRYRPHVIQVHLPLITPQAWERVVAAIVADVPLATRLLAGDGVQNIESAFEAAGVRLALTDADIVSRTTDSLEAGPMCRHALCAVMLAAEAIDIDATIMMTLRGMTRDDLAERVRQRRALASSTSGSVSAYERQRPPDAERLVAPLELDLESFWEAGPSLSEVETPLRGPEVSHPLLRRLGPSPFKEGQFPLVGLLATCYDVASDFVLREADAEASGGTELADTPELAPSTPAAPKSPTRAQGKARRKG